MCSDVDVSAQALESREDTTEMEVRIRTPMAELVDAPASEAGDASHESSRLSWGTTRLLSA